MSDEISRRAFVVTGIVQGVGFRPFVYERAVALGLSGFVMNDSAGVRVEVEGSAAAVGAFAASLEEEAPPLALIDGLREVELEPQGDDHFEIRASAAGAVATAPISPDVATCDACLAEVDEPGNRRYGYAFTNCTNCGPRFTITRAVPYDRANTTMADFEMCDACRAEYEDPADRRFHAQPIACPACGPALRLVDAGGEAIEGDPVAMTAQLIRGGRIVAIKGLGGYHLACDATNEAAVTRLRQRKNREEKPFAVMVASTDAAHDVAFVGDDERRVLSSRRRPIVITTGKPGEVAASVAPRSSSLGLMLPYTPLHHMLMRAVGRPVVLTSGNVSDEPIAFEDADALRRLGAIADVFLVHDREIFARCDDSVVRVVSGAEYPIRRARGFAPEPLAAPVAFPRPILAVGAQLKNTFCLGIGRRAILSHHIGDLENWASMTAFREGAAHLTRIYETRPEVLAHDLHPEYLSTKWALEQEDVQAVGVQHHHAHIASCLADNARAEAVIGLALDGTGYGDDGAVWGCEVLVCDLTTFTRVDHLPYVALPGGAAAVREPWRMAAVYLHEAFDRDAADLDLDFVRRTRAQWRPILQMGERGINSPPTSSAGRLFDAVAALCGLRDRSTFEGQAAMELEQLANGAESYANVWDSDEALDGVELVRHVVRDLVDGRTPRDVAAAFHASLAARLVASCVVARDAHGIGVVALSGGTWQNVLLLELTRQGLTAAGFEILIHRRVPPNDGGVSLGQAAVAAARA